MTDVAAEPAVGAGPLCPACGAEVIAGDVFCEACGAALGPLPAGDGTDCVGCGAPGSEVDADGYCSRCGRKQPDGRDHLEEDRGRMAGVTDRGLRHFRNEDAMAVAFAPHDGVADALVLAVVCDGVSSSQEPQLASQGAAEAALAVLAAAAAEGFVDADAPDHLRAAVAAAQGAASTVPWSHEGTAPSCTIVAATLGPDTVHAAWLGDSRAYWLAGDASVRITTDDSWAAEQVAAGLMDEPTAEADPRAHSITRWLGADAVDLDPHVVSLPATGDGRLLVCSDGLWNYEGAAGRLAAVAADRGPMEAALALCQLALDAGGHDNITVVIADRATADRPAAAQPSEPPTEDPHAVQG